MRPHIPVIDIFAGPGGLGEGFAQATNGARHSFQIALSIEKDTVACKTLRLRSFFRIAHRMRDRKAIASYYRYLRGNLSTQEQLFAEHPAIAAYASQEVLEATLGETPHTKIRQRIRTALGLSSSARPKTPWVLIGGPPCQAYSLAGRSRMLGVKGKTFYKDARHTLYREYITLLNEFRPTAFVMENVKGILSSTLEGDLIFNRILRDLALFNAAGEARYRLYAMTAGVSASGSHLNTPPSPRDFILRAEEYGVPQARHRVIIVGIDARLEVPRSALWLTPGDATHSVCDAIDDLPALRSGLSRADDSPAQWSALIERITASLQSDLPATAGAQSPLLASTRSANPARDTLQRGARFLACEVMPRIHKDFLHDPRLQGACNHETRTHIADDLARYYFLARFGELTGSSPRLQDFPARLIPKHKSARVIDATTPFNDRFRVQLANLPSTTITSHISKDGHYFVHYDSSQTRSITVREAARLQTFPDNYFFEGPRTKQYHQVGNAVPPWLARQIAERLAASLPSAPYRH